MKKSIVVVYMRDWQGLYVDEKLVAEGERLGIYDLVAALKLDISYHYPDSLPLTKAVRFYNKYKHLPDKLEDTFEK
jgi:hypothetical protein